MKELVSIPQKLSGPFIYLTTTGYYKNGWAVLNGTELYKYDT